MYRAISKPDYVLIAAAISALGLILFCSFRVYCLFKSRQIEALAPLVLTCLTGLGGPVFFLMLSVVLEIILFDYDFQDRPVFGFRYHLPIVVFGGCIAGLATAILHLRSRFPQAFRQDRNMAADYGEQSVVESTDLEP